MLESYIFDSSVSRHDLKSVAKRYLDIEVTEFADIVSKDSRTSLFSRCRLRLPLDMLLRMLTLVSASQKIIFRYQKNGPT